MVEIELADAARAVGEEDGQAVTRRTSK